MTDYQRIVDDLRNTVLQGGGNRQARVDEILAEYAEACRVTNDRLRQCEAMLRKGLRGEAIQLAEIEPNLLEQFALLDFPERDMVAGNLAMFDRDLPPLLSTVAADLNDAYAAQLPLESLLSRHRFLALAGAALKQRLELLRKLVEIDSLNPIWSEDVEVYETERLREIKVEGNRAVDAGDLAKLQELVEEVYSPQWRQTIPTALKQTLEAACAKQVRSRAAEELSRLSRELNLAHAALDFKTADGLKTSWYAVLVDYTPPDDDPIWWRVKEALKWVADTTAQNVNTAYVRAALAKLEAALDRAGPSDRKEFDECYHGAIRAGEIPPEVEARYRDRIAALDRAARNKLVLRVFGGVVGAALLIAAIVYGVQSSSRNRRVGEAVAQLSTLVDEAGRKPERVAAARDFLSELERTDPATFGESNVARLAAELDGVESRERNRSAAFRAALDRVKSSGPDSPDYGALKQATDLARTPQEKTEIDYFQADVATAMRQSQERLDRTLAGEIDDLKGRVDELERSGVDDFERATAAVKNLRAEASSLSARYPTAKPSTAAGLQPIMMRIDGIEASANRGQAERLALRNVFAMQADLKTYVATIAKFVNEHPNSARAADLRQAASEAYLWNKVDDWNREAAELIRLEADPAKRKEFAGRLDAAGTNFPQIPQVGNVAARLAHVRDLLGRFDASGIPHTTILKASLDAKVLTDSWLVATSRGENYYVPATVEPDKSLSTQRVEYYADYVSAPKIALLDPNRIVRVERAPHCALTAELKAEIERIRTLGDDFWETGFATLVRSVMKAEKIDPILRLALIKAIVSMGESGSRYLGDAIKPEHDALENAATNLLVNWMDPRNADARSAAQNAPQDLSKLADLADKFTSAAAAAQQGRKALRPLFAYSRCGCLTRDSSGRRFAPIDPAVAPAEGVLYVAVSAASGPILRRIGRSTTAGVVFETDDAALLVEGRPIWSAGE